MTNADQSSLDRYLLNNGHRLLGQPATQAGAKFQTAFGAVFTVASLAVLPFSFEYGWYIAVAMTGPFTAGIINLIVGVNLLKKSRGPEVAVKVDL